MAASFTHHVGMNSPNWTTSASDALRAGAGFSLAALDPAATPGFTGGKAEGAAELEERGRIVGELQERLFAQSVAGTAAGSVLLVLQAMDTGGKGGIVRRVVGAVDPQGVELAAFKKPTEEEPAHDFLWRLEQPLPGSGRDRNSVGEGKSV